MRPHSCIALACAAALSLAGCSDPQVDLGPLDDPRKPDLGKMQEIDADEVCGLVPVEQIEAAMEAQVSAAEPSWGGDKGGHWVDFYCFYRAEPVLDSVSVHVSYHRTTDLNARLREARADEDTVKIEEIDGLADAALFFPDDTVPGDTPVRGLGSVLDAFTEYADGVRTVSVNATRERPVGELRAVVEDVLAALDMGQD